MIEIRCPNCGKLLGKYSGMGEVKCTRASCGKKILFDTNQKLVKIAPAHVPLKSRSVSSGHTFR